MMGKQVAHPTELFFLHCLGVIMSYLHRKQLLLTLAVVMFVMIYSARLEAAQPPNVILVFVDDMGWGDFSCFGDTEASTPNIDAMAAKGIRFEQFYVNSPICSPSRTAITTGCYPQRYGISSYLDRREINEQRGINSWLDPKAVTLARCLHESGYATGHFGKWHMGGQRNVDDAPAITCYGYDESLTNFEGMGPKLLPLTEVPDGNGGIKKGRIWEDAERLGGPCVWMLRSKITSGFVDRALEFIDKSKADGKPFYVNVWPDDVHSPYFPSVGRWSNEKREKYLAVLEEMDTQFGRLFDKISNDQELCNNTLILICSDNGPEEGAGSAGPFRGGKTMLYEGGVRSSLIAWGPGFIDNSKAGTVNKESVFSAIDLVPSLLDITGVKALPGSDFDGEDLASVILGKSQESRQAPIFFRRPPDRNSNAGIKNLPDMSVRDGKWKLLCEYDGSLVQLYDLELDRGESVNVADEHPEIVSRLKTALMAWNSTMPKDAGDPTYKKN